MKRPFGVLAEKLTADFALLLLEPVRSAEPAKNSIGIAAAIASIAASDDLRVATFSGVSSSAFLCAFSAFASDAGRSWRSRRSNSARLRLPSSAKRASHSPRAAAPRLPDSRPAFSNALAAHDPAREEAYVCF